MDAAPGDDGSENPWEKKERERKDRIGKQKKRCVWSGIQKSKKKKAEQQRQIRDRGRKFRQNKRISITTERREEGASKFIVGMLRLTVTLCKKTARKLRTA